MTSEERPKAPPTIKKEATVKKQTVAGFVICRQTDEGPKYLLLYRRGTYWNFPKGKFEEGENDFSAALRELHEETGLTEADLKIVPGFKTQLRYNFRIGDERIYDTVILYLAETEKADVVISPREHSGFAWFLFGDAMKIVGTKYVGTKRVLKQAHDFMRKAYGLPDTRPHMASRGPRRPHTPPTSGPDTTAGARPPMRKRYSRRGRGRRGPGTHPSGQGPLPSRPA